MFRTRLFFELGLSAILYAAGYRDNCCGKVPNGIIAAGVIWVTMLHFLLPPEVVLSELAGPLAACAGFYLLYHFRLFGGGDVKLFLLIVYAFPNRKALDIMTFSLGIGAVWGLVRIRTGQGIADRPLAGGKTIKVHQIPFAVCIFLGTLCVLVNKYLA